jgi:EAL domain-containing protein (putative c-di-GMP-specific phosphodiesterase class I)
LPPGSNRLSDAPSANFDGDLPDFCGGRVKPADLSTVFQPIVHLATGKVFAYETLVRCGVPGFAPIALFERASAERSTGRLGRMIREIPRERAEELAASVCAPRVRASMGSSIFIGKET